MGSAPVCAEVRRLGHQEAIRVAVTEASLCFAQSPEGVYSWHCDQDQKDDPWWADVEMLAAMVTFFDPKGNFLLWFYSACIGVLLDHGDKFRAGEFLRAKVRALQSVFWFSLES